MVDAPFVCPECGKAVTEPGRCVPCIKANPISEPPPFKMTTWMRLTMWTITPSALWFLLMLLGPAWILYAWLFMFYVIAICFPVVLLQWGGLLGSWQLLNSPMGGMVACPNGLAGWMTVLVCNAFWVLLIYFLVFGRGSPSKENE